MDLSQKFVITSSPAEVFKALVNPEALSEWWGCTALVEAREGGLWGGGWGIAEDGYGHQNVLSAIIERYRRDVALSLVLGEATIAFDLASHPEGTELTLGLDGFSAATPEAKRANMQTWVGSMEAMKAWVEAKHPWTPQPSPQPTPMTAPSSPPSSGAPSPDIPGGAPAGADPYAALAQAKARGAEVVDEGGFGVTDPHAVVSSYSKEQGFGYVTHSQLGEVSFDYNGCDFEPAVGDQVLLLVIGKRYDGKPKIKRIACPAKGSNIQ